MIVYLLYGTDGVVGFPVRLSIPLGKVTSVTGDLSMNLMSARVLSYFYSCSYVQFVHLMICCSLAPAA